MTTTELKKHIMLEATRLYEKHMLNENDGWTTAIMNASEVGDFIDNYLEGWNLQYDAPVDLGNGKVSIRHQEETEDVMNQMNHQNAEERLSNMDDKSNYSDLDENEFGDDLERMKNSEYYLNGVRVYPEINYWYNQELSAILNGGYYKFDKIEGEEGKYSLRLPKDKPSQSSRI